MYEIIEILSALGDQAIYCSSIYRTVNFFDRTKVGCAEVAYKNNIFAKSILIVD